MNRNQLTEIVLGWQKRLGLQQWEIEINWDEFEEEEDNYASTWRTRDYKEAKIKWNKNWETWSLKRANEIVVHELLHLFTHDLEFILDAIDEQLHRDVDAVICKMYTHSMEGVVDSLAKRIVEIGGLIDPLPTHISSVRNDFPY